MNKQNSNNVIALRISAPMFEAFKAACSQKDKTMSEVLRGFIKRYIEENQGSTSESAELLF